MRLLPIREPPGLRKLERTPAALGPMPMPARLARLHRMRTSARRHRTGLRTYHRPSSFQRPRCQLRRLASVDLTAAAVLPLQAVPRPELNRRTRLLRPTLRLPPRRS